MSIIKDVRKDETKRTNYAYATAYAIQIIHIHHDDNGLAPFLTESGLTTIWPCQAMLFDSDSIAIEKMLSIDMPIECEGEDNAYLRVVELELNSNVRVIAIREILRKAA